MKTASHSDQCLSFIHCQVSPANQQPLPPAKLRPTITLSRQAGSGAMTIASELSAWLQARGPTPGPWTVIDKNLVEKVLEEHQLPPAIARFMPEDRVSAIQDAVEEILGLHPATRTLWQHTAATILHLAEIGQVILIGRATNIITRQLPNAFHVRLVAPLEVRVQQVMANHSLDAKAALEWVRQTDRARHSYVKAHFNADVDDCLQYDLVINTARLPQRVVVHLIGEAVLQWAATLETSEELNPHP